MLSLVCNQKVRAIERLTEGVRLDPLSPMGSRAQFEEWYNNRYAFGLSSHVDDMNAFIAERFDDSPPFDTEMAPRYAGRAFVGLPPVDLGVLIDWIIEAIEAGEDLEDRIEEWFGDLAQVHPDNAFVLLFWGDARRHISIRKYGTRSFEPHVPSMRRR